MANASAMHCVPSRRLASALHRCCGGGKRRRGVAPHATRAGAAGVLSNVSASVDTPTRRGAFCGSIGHHRTRTPATHDIHHIAPYCPPTPSQNFLHPATVPLDDMRQCRSEWSAAGHHQLLHCNLPRLHPHPLSIVRQKRIA
ncbi:unnamed protein product [Acanthoscelides obtectus]|uniref:Uncharacterized protein n=1 Tax=Acanthoscelides obtectus TaxID=200917 RepID=A0A9P0P0J6_ACAOB|nr:unnamed protein product [Acanthoscelides obtectus]CAK1640345.1 hypothetical protein AOBTE_LOCUS11665 [Acanthoscelides obtectus]